MRLNLRKLRFALIAYVLFDLYIGGTCGGIFPLAQLAAAQFTQVTGTVTDPNGLPYASGTITPVLVIPSGAGSPTLNGLPYSPPTSSIGLDKTGSFLLNLADNTVLLPASTKWSFTVCSAQGTIQPAGGKGPICFIVPALTISGASQSISAAIAAVPPPALSSSAGGGGGPVTTALTPENFGAIGNGSNDDSAAFTTGCAAVTDLWLTSTHTYAMKTNSTVGCNIHYTNTNQFIIAPGVTTTFNGTQFAGINQIFTEQTTTSVADTMQRANESPMSDGGNWSACIGIPAGQLVSNAYEEVVAGTAVSVCWTGSGSFGANQISTVQIKTNNSAADTTCALVRASLAALTFYRACVITALGSAAQIQLQKDVSGTFTVLVSCSIPLFSGDFISISAVGTTITGYLNSAPISACNATDAAIASGFPGMIADGAAAIANSQITSWSGATTDTGAVAFGANTTTVFPEWFSAKGNAPTTDDTIAIQAAINSLSTHGGEVLNSPKTYKQTQTLFIVNNFTTLRGAPVGAFAPVYKSYGPVDMDQVLIQGLSGSLLQYNGIQDMSFARNVAGASAGAAVHLVFAQWTQVQRVNMFDSFYGFEQANGNANTFLQQDIADTTLGGSPSGGYFYSGGQNSSRNIDCIIIGGQGFLLTGPIDLFFDGPETSGSQNPFVVTTSFFDVHVMRPVFDAANSSVAVSGTGTWIEFDNIYIAGPALAQIDIENTEGVHFNGGVVRSTSITAGTVQAKINGTSKRNTILGIRFDSPNATTGDVTGILVSGGASDNIISNNDISGTSGHAFVTGISLTGSSGNVINGNTVSGFGATGVSFDATSNNNQFRGNIVDTTNITTRVSDSGAGNSKNWTDQGTCTMAAGTCGAQTLNSGTYSVAPLCTVTWTGGGALAGTVKVASTTTTVTPSSSNGADTAVVNWMCAGN